MARRAAKRAAANSAIQIALAYLLDNITLIVSVGRR
jgi:hypothetical protein